jgi:hypothetical protein
VSQRRLSSQPAFHAGRRCVGTSDNVIEDDFTSTPDSRIWDFSPIRFGAAPASSLRRQDGYYNQHFNVHGTKDTNGDNKSTGYGGTAGDYYEIAYNAIRGDQGYSCFIFCFKMRPA